jgi:hypothetical protein
MIAVAIHQLLIWVAGARRKMRFEGSDGTADVQDGGSLDPRLLMCVA